MGFSGVAFRGHGLVLNLIVLGLAMVLYSASVYLWLGRWMYEGARLNLPFIVPSVAYYTVAHVLFHLVFGPLVFDPDFATSLGRFNRTYFVALLLSLAYNFSAMPRAKIMLTQAGTPGQEPVDPQPVLPGVEGKLRLIRVDGKMATIVTDTGRRVVRSGLTELVQGLDPDLGLRCHRSLWVAKDQIAGLIYLKGNPHITLSDDSLFAISRSAVPQVRTFLARMPR